MGLFFFSKQVLIMKRYDVSEEYHVIPLFQNHFKSVVILSR